MNDSESRFQGTISVTRAGERKIIKFINGVRKPEELAVMLDTDGNRKASLSAARKVLNYRTKNGRFKNLDEVRSISRLLRERLDGFISNFLDIETTLPAMEMPEFLLDEQYNDNLAASVIEFSVEESATHGPRCEATFQNWNLASPGFLWPDRSVLDFGKTLRIPGTRLTDIFSGCITGIKADYPEGALPTITVTAENKYEAIMTLNRRTRTFENLTDGQVVRQIAGEYGMSVDAEEGTMHELLAQSGQSDIEYIRERARATGSEVMVYGETLRVRPPGNFSQPSFSFTYGRHLKEFSVTADITNQRTSVTAFAWDPSQKSVSSQRITESDMTEDAQTGSQILREALAAAGEEITQAGGTPWELQLLAGARYRETSRRFCRGSAVIGGYAGVRAGYVVKLNGLGSMFSGRYYVNRVKQTYKRENGYISYLDVERSGIGLS